MKKILMIALSAGLILGACSKDFLEQSSTRFISKDDIDEISKTSPHLMEATMNGLYAYNLKAYSGGTTRHDDFGQKGYDVFTDMLIGDMVLNSAIYGWYRDIANLQAPTLPTSNANYEPWRFYYYMIRGTNNVIQASGGNDAVPETEGVRVVLAQAKAFRAYMYYNLVNLFTAGYDANEKILPIYTEPSHLNLPAKNTQEVFDVMIKDLTDAISLFEMDGRTGKGPNINMNVAKGFLAYVYAAKGTNDALLEVKKLTQDVINEYPLANKAELLGGFNNIAANPNWIWGAQVSLENNLDLVSWWGQIDIYTYSYAYVGDVKGMSKELYEAIRPDDIRKQQFAEDFTVRNSDDKVIFRGGEDTYLPVNKFYSAKGKVLGGQRKVESDYLFMRVEEMYLLNAEASARLGQDGEAIETLKSLLENRIEDISYLSSLAGNALLDEILLQNRIELWGEGKVYAAFKRNKRSATYGSNHLYHAGKTFNYDDSRLILSVPQAETLNNPVYNN